MAPRQPLEALLDALVDVEQPKLEVQDRFAGHAEPEVPGLDDAGVNGSDRHLEHALAGHGPERMEVPGDARHDAVVGKVLAERPRAVRPVVVKRDARRIRMALGHEAEEVHDLAFEPVRRRILRRDRRVRRAWPDRSAPRGEERSACRGSDQTWCTTKRPVAWRSSLAKSDISRPSETRATTRSASAGSAAALGLERQFARRAARGPRHRRRRARPTRWRRPTSCAPPHDLRRRVNQRQQRRGQVERGHDRHDRRDDRRGQCRDRSAPAAARAGRSDRAAGRARGVPI